MTRLFVAGYPREATKDELLALFRQFGTGPDDITFPRDRRTRRKKGYAYISVADDRADAAIEAFHLFEIAGRSLTVVRAVERPQRQPRG